MFQAHTSLLQNQKWSLNHQGICLLEENGSPTACVVFNKWDDSSLNSAVGSIKMQWVLKLVGTSAFLKSASKFFKAKGFEVAKEVEREGSFEVIFDLQTKKFRVSAGAASASPEPVKAAVQQVAPVANEKIKVLIVDDSSTVRNLLQSIFKNEPSIEVVGALDLPSKVEPFIKEHQPDVITLDIHMPEMDGVQLLRKIQPKYNIPTIMISSLSQEDGPYVFDALELGAFDYIKKPTFNEIATVGPFIIERIKLAGKMGARKKQKSTSAAPSTAATLAGQKVQERWDTNKFLMLIGSSTGGTEALKTLFHQFPDEIPPVLVVQHIPPVFSKALADRLNTFFKFTVKEAEDGDLVVPNQVLIAPGGKQMGVKSRGSDMVVYINDEAPMNRHKPSVDYMFQSAEKLKISQSMIAIMLTGMGNDGAKHMKNLHDMGVHTIAQDEESCVVYGMPKAAVELGAAKEIVNLNRIGYHISRYMSGGYKKKSA